MVDESAWLDGTAIDAFMAWAIHKDIPFFEGVRDDFWAGVSFTQAQRFSWPLGTATTIYFPTHLQVQFHNLVGLQSITTSPRCTASGYKEAILLMEQALMIYNISQKHWVLFHLVVAESTLYAIDMYRSPLVDESHAYKFLEFLFTLLSKPAYLSYTIKIVTPEVDPCLPVQLDGYSCGVFTAVLAYHIMKRAKIHFEQCDISEWRSFMLEKVLSLSTYHMRFDVV